MQRERRRAPAPPDEQPMMNGTPHRGARQRSASWTASSPFTSTLTDRGARPERRDQQQSTTHDSKHIRITPLAG